MSIPVDLYGAAPAVAEGMVYSLVGGTALALLIWLVLRLVPRKSSGTQFIVWFSTLLAVTVLPFLGPPSMRTGAAPSAGGTASGHAGHAFFMLPASWAVCALVAWAVIAIVNLVRVAIGFWQVLRLRQSCVPIDLKGLGPEVQEIVGLFQQSRPVLIGTSDKLDVPTAIGFLKPAVLLPSWLVPDVSPIELKHILLHELAHLRRRDDWTNLVQKTVKAVMFFHPLVWWIERRLSLEREVACDDAVLVQTESPRTYAQCLARVAEKSFLRRQMALAQAAVGRMHPLSLRLVQILDLDRPRTTQLWKPAIPLVAFLAVLCGSSMRQAPALVGFTQERPAGQSATPSATKPALAGNRTHPMGADGLGARLLNAGFKLEKEQQRSVPDKAVRREQPPIAVKRTEVLHPGMLLARYSGYVVAHEELVVTMTDQGVAPGHWQVRVWQLRVLVPARQEMVTPRKT